MATIYVLQQGNYFKIGLTKRDFNKRLKELQTGCPFELKPKLLISTNRPELLEKLLHAKFSQSRRLGEWFSLTPAEQTLLFPHTATKAYCDFNEQGQVIRSSPHFLLTPRSSSPLNK